MTSCASPGPEFAANPRLDVPSWALQPCSVSLAPGDRLTDLEIGYRSRGTDVLACDAKRELAVNVHTAEHDLDDKMQTARTRRAGRLCQWFGVRCS